MKKHDTINGVLLLEAHEASELLDKGSYYYEQDGEVRKLESFFREKVYELHGTGLVIVGFSTTGCGEYPCVEKALYEQLTNEAV